MSKKTELAAAEPQKETVQQATARLISELSGNIGLTDAELANLDLQQLTMLSDNMNVIENVTVKKQRTSIATQVISNFQKRKVTEMSEADFLLTVMKFNIDNFFNVHNSVADKVDDVTEVKTFKTWSLLGYLKSNEIKHDDATRMEKFIRRASAYTKSHLIGDGDLSLFKSDNKFYFEFDNGTYKLVEKTA